MTDLVVNFRLPDGLPDEVLEQLRSVVLHDAGMKHRYFIGNYDITLRPKSVGPEAEKRLTEALSDYFKFIKHPGEKEAGARDLADFLARRLGIERKRKVEVEITFEMEVGLYEPIHADRILNEIVERRGLDRGFLDGNFNVNEVGE